MPIVGPSAVPNTPDTPNTPMPLPIFSFGSEALATVMTRLPMMLYCTPCRMRVKTNRGMVPVTA